VHAGVVSVQFKPGKVEEAARIYQDSVVPELRQMRGFEGGYVLTNAETGKGYIVGLCESREDGRALRAAVPSGSKQPSLKMFSTGRLLEKSARSTSGCERV
jgi:hypothetical protein